LPLQQNTLTKSATAFNGALATIGKFRVEQETLESGDSFKTATLELPLHNQTPEVLPLAISNMESGERIEALEEQYRTLME
jgi:hypothetical protein